MRAFDRELIRGGHYGQRSCEPRSKAEHMAAPTKPCDVKILLANSDPSTHGTSATCAAVEMKSAYGGKAEISLSQSDYLSVPAFRLGLEIDRPIAYPCGKFAPGGHKS